MTRRGGEGLPAQSEYRFPPSVHISKCDVGVLKCLLQRVAHCFSLRNARCIIARMGTCTCAVGGRGAVRDDGTRVYLSSSPLPLRQHGGGHISLEVFKEERDCLVSIPPLLSANWMKKTAERKP